MREIACAYLSDIMYAPKTLVVVGQGMVGYKLLECLADNGATDTWQVIAFGEEPRPAYDRVNLSTYFSGRTAEDLSVADPEVLGHPSIEFIAGDRSGRWASPSPPRSRPPRSCGRRPAGGWRGSRSPTAGGWPPTWSSTRPGSGPGTSWPGPPASTSASGAASSPTGRAAPPTPTSTPSEASPPSVAASTASSAPATPRPGWWPTVSPAARPPSTAPTCRPS